jgi:hypothetical protein
MRWNWMAALALAPSGVGREAISGGDSIRGLVEYAKTRAQQPPFPFGHRVERNRVSACTMRRLVVRHLLRDRRRAAGRGLARPIPAVLHVAIGVFARWLRRTGDPVHDFAPRVRGSIAIAIAGHHGSAATKAFPIASVASGRVDCAFALHRDLIAAPENQRHHRENAERE